MSKWQGLEREGYRIYDLGRPLIFLIPHAKLQIRLENETVEDYIAGFLTKNFGAFTTTEIPTFGVWIDGKGAIALDRCRQYEVSFLGKDKIPIILNQLAEICRLIGEDCLYVKAGQYAALIYPTN